MSANVRRTLPLLIAVVLIFLTIGCAGDDVDQGDDDADDVSLGGDHDAPPADETDDGEDIGGYDGDPLVEPPLGDNPALDYGPYNVIVRLIHIPDDVTHTAYLFVPEIDGKEMPGPFPTLVWGHGIYSSGLPKGQSEIFFRQASKGYLVLYPNMDVPFPFPEDDTVINGVFTYLRTIKAAVDLGLADPNQIIFGGCSFGARVAALATAMTGKLDLFNAWPNPVACIYEALPDFNESAETWPVTFPGPRPSEWAQFFDPSIPQTILCAEDDFVVRTYDSRTGDAMNGALFFENLPSEFAQLIILSSGTGGPLDKARHSSFMAVNDRSLDSFDLWGHMKFVAGLTYFHFKGGSRQWAYGALRGFGGLDRANKPIMHEVVEKGPATDGPAEAVPQDE